MSSEKHFIKIQIKISAECSSNIVWLRLSILLNTVTDQCIKKRVILVTFKHKAYVLWYIYILFM